jgi:5-methylcytosine-specific restriction endonuclease McrA
MQSYKAAYNNAYYRDNIVAERARRAFYRRANPNKINAYTALRRARLQKSTPPDADHIKINFMFSLAGELNRQLGTDFEVDHIRPISRRGKHHHYNLQLLTKSENCSKNAKVGIPATGFTVRTFEAVGFGLSFLPGGMRQAIEPEE